MLILCAAPVDHSSDPELAAIQKKALNEVTYELIRQVTSPTDLLRQQVRSITFTSINPYAYLSSREVLGINLVYNLR